MARKPMFYNAILLTAVNLALRFVSTSFQVFISARLGAEGVGLLQLVLSVGSFAMTAGMAGIRTATMYLTAEALGRHHRERIPHILGCCLVYSLICGGTVAALLYGFAPMIAETWITRPEILPAIRFFAVFLPIACVSGCLCGYFTAANRISTLAAVEIGEQAASMTLTVILLCFWAGSDPTRAICAVIIGSGLGSIVTASSLGILHQLEHLPNGEKRPIARKLLSTAVPLGLADDLKIGINTLESLMVPRRLALYPGTGSALGSFGMVSGMVFPILMFPACILYALAELLIPELARCAAAGSRLRIRYLTTRSLRIALLYGCLFGGLMHLLAGWLCDSLYRSSEAGDMLRLYTWLTPMLYCDAITDAINKGLGQQKTAVRYNILTAVLDVIGLYILLPRYGMTGYFISFTFSHAVNFLLSLGLLMRISGVTIPFQVPLLSLCAAILGVIIGAFAAPIPLRILGFLDIYGSLLVLFRVVSREDLTWFRGLVTKK